MKQVAIQKGKVKLINVPSPKINYGEILVVVQASTISIGTEVADIKNSGEKLYEKAVKSPEKVINILNLSSEYGIKNTINYVNAKQNEYYPTGYSCSGYVLDVGPGVTEFSIGQKVACAGSKYAFHAEIIKVPKNLCAPLPEDIDFPSASTVSLGAIALQGIRRANPTLGECFVVIGLGFIGQITVQLLKANGCRVFGVDKDNNRVKVAKEIGLEFGFSDIEDLNKKVNNITNGFGADGVIITASSSSHSIISQAFMLCRKRGRVVLVGDVGLNLKREDFYINEVDLLISSSYGPGRYERNYEECGLDYPIGYVRWTENRNMREYLRQLSNKQINLKKLIQSKYSLENVTEAYKDLDKKDKPILVILSYKKFRKEKFLEEKRIELNIKRTGEKDQISLGVIGAGEFAKSTHLPNIRKYKNLFKLVSICNDSGISSKNAGEQFHADYICNDYKELINDQNIQAILVATRHDLHSTITLDCLKSGKHVLVEKPLAINMTQLETIKEFYSDTDSKPILLTGYNRRFSPYIIRLKNFIMERKMPFIINYRVNAGYISRNNWINDINIGGGRNIGEACHFYDLFCFLADSDIEKITAQAINYSKFKNSNNVYEKPYANENFVATIKFKNQCVCNLIYTSMGNKKIEKEYFELFIDGMIFVLNDFKKLESYGDRPFIFKTNKQDKGYINELKEFYKSIKFANYVIPIEDQFKVSQISFEIENLINIDQ